MNPKSLQLKWNKEVEGLQQKKAKLLGEVLIIDVKLNDMMIEYDKLVNKLLNNIK